MEKNYYEILEINKNASKEIMDKAYKTLIKKYHPDLQENNLKEKYEEKIKIINEAYDVLSDPQKREKYDLFLNKNEISEEDFNNLKNENINLKKEINYLKNYYNKKNNEINKNIQNNINYKNKINNNLNNENNYEKINNTINKAYTDAYQKAYHDAYIQDLKNRGYKIKYKKTFKNYLALFLTIIIIYSIFFILWQIPYTKAYLIYLYNENVIIQFFVSIFSNK